MLQFEIWWVGKLFINYCSVVYFVIIYGGGDVISVCVSSGGFFSQFSFQVIQCGGVIGRYYVDFMQVLCLRCVNWFCGKNVKRKGGKCDGCNSIFNGFYD